MAELGNTSFLLQATGLPSHGCQNLLDDDEATKLVYVDKIYLRPEHKKRLRRSLDDLAIACRAFKIRNCTNSQCLEKREDLDKSAPECRWTEFRDWALVAMSCHSSSSSLEDHESEKRRILDSAVEYCRDVYVRLKFENWDEDRVPDLFGTCQILYWMMPGGPAIDPMVNAWGKSVIDIPKIREAIRLSSYREARVCRRRLWSLVEASDRKVIDLPAILSMLQRFPSSFHTRDHRDCTADTCHFDDDNTTENLQHHKCGDRSCGEHMYFDPEEIDRILVHGSPEEHFSTAWSIPKPENPSFAGARDWMAISHVWADGTGRGGGKSPGTVNFCLVDFFAKIAESKEIGCNSIWWDTICVPSGDNKRLALKRMHHNYRDAKHTLVHDEELARFDWKNDGSPCLALALSTWFTRGWTALELQQSRSIKVVFRNPDTGEPLIKDLEKDILAEKTGSSIHLAHRVASAVIRQVRGSRPTMVSWTNIVSTLKPRSTSWAMDRLIIASLMAGVCDFPPNWTQSNMTKAILLNRPRITPRALLHGRITMCDMGPWSWCPISILDLENDIIGQPLEITTSGAILGSWSCMPLNHAEIHHIVPSHQSVMLQVEDALCHENRCLLLTLHGTKSGVPRDCLLVMNWGSSLLNGKKTRHCQYIGAVVASYQGRGFTCEICMGCEEEIGWHDEDGISSQGADWGGWTQLHFEVNEKKVTDVQDLLGKEVDVNARDDMGRTALDWAERSGSLKTKREQEIIDLLKTYGGQNGHELEKVDDTSVYPAPGDYDGP
jgi:hypothetical protein